MNTKQKIVSVATLVDKLGELRREGKSVVFTNGCFDLMHLGHVSYLEEARSKGDCLVVGVNSDRSVQSIKGNARPIVPQEGRARVLAALACIDYVVVFDEETPYELIKALQPHVLVKGADWKDKGIVGEDVVTASGGRVEFIDFVDSFSTTNIIQTILKKCA